MNAQTLEANFTLFANSLPPQNVDAEEAIIGGILLDPDAISRVSDILKPEAFYISSHRDIYKCVLQLYEQGEPIDLMSVSSWLYDNEMLDKVGGQAKLAQVVDRTVSTVNIDRYAKLVIEKYQRRQLIGVGNRIVQLSLDNGLNLETIQEELKDLANFTTNNSFAQEYESLIGQIGKIIKEEVNPGLRSALLSRLALKYKKEYGLGAKGLEDLYFRDLVNREYEPFLNFNELKKKYEGQEQKWLINGLIPAASTILVHAPGGTGKTRFFYKMIQRITEGIEHELFSLGEQGNVAIIQTDESPEQTISTLTKQGLDTDKLLLKTRWTIEQIPQLKREIEALEVKPKLILIDNLSTVSRFSLFTENEIEYARPILLLNEIARDFGITFVLVHHSNKNADVRGTTAIINSVDLELKIGKDPQDLTGDYRLLTIGKTRMRRPAQYKFCVDWDTNDWNFVEEQGEEANSSNASTKDKILKFLKQNRGTTFECEELHQEVGSSIGNIRKLTGLLAADGLIQKKRLNKFNRNGYYLPLPITNNVPVAQLSIADPSPSMDQPMDQPQTPCPESDSSIPDPCAAKIEFFSTTEPEKNFNSDGSAIRDGYKPEPEPTLRLIHEADRGEQLPDQTYNPVTEVNKAEEVCLADFSEGDGITTKKGSRNGWVTRIIKRKGSLTKIEITWADEQQFAYTLEEMRMAGFRKIN